MKKWRIMPGLLIGGAIVFRLVVDAVGYFRSRSRALEEARKNGKVTR
ncbi:MAG: hypothetical protein K6360_02920 [Deltaproteobacteria bacterium]